MDPWKYINISPSGNKHSGILHVKKQKKKINKQATDEPKTISKVKLKKKHSFGYLKNEIASSQFQ